MPEFLDAMRALKKWAKVSYGKLEQLGGKDAAGALLLPHSTMNRLLAKSNATKMPDNSQLAAFVLACGLTEEQWREWSWVHADITSTGEASSTMFPAFLDRLGQAHGGLRIAKYNWVAGARSIEVERLHVDGAAPTWTWSNASPATAAAA